jgi:transitional endoplasmic reticulum ATPase
LYIGALNLHKLPPLKEMIDMAQNEITLKVAEALSQREIGQGIARLDPNAMSDLDIKERDLIEIAGDRRTAAIALPSQTDIGLGVIRIDGLVRKNS